MRPVFFADSKDIGLRAEEQAFLLGADLLIIPKWQPAPHLPGGQWQTIHLVSGEDAPPNDKYQPELRQRGGSILTLGKVVQSTVEESLDPLTLSVCLDERGEAKGTLYEDAGDGYGYQHGDYLLTTYHAQRVGGSVVVSVAGVQGQRRRPNRTITVEITGEHGVVTGTGKDGAPISVALPK